MKTNAKRIGFNNNAVTGERTLVVRSVDAAGYVTTTPIDTIDKLNEVMTETGEMMSCTHEKFISPTTKLTHEQNYKYNAPHHFGVFIHNADGAILNIKQVDFQEGPVNECGANGITNEDLITMVIARLEGFQKSEFACKDNAEALEHLYAAMDKLNTRTLKRIKRGVEGTNKI